MLDYTELGYSFAFEDNFSITTGATVNLLFDYTTYTDLTPSNQDNRTAQRGGIIIVSPPSFTSSGGPVSVVVYRGTDYTGGSAVRYAKVNTLSDAAPQVSITQGATGSDKGTITLQYLVGGFNTTPKGTGGNTIGGVMFYRDNTVKTLVEITNNSGGDITFHWSQLIFEV